MEERKLKNGNDAGAQKDAPKQFGKQDGLVEGPATATRGGTVRATVNGNDKTFVVRTLAQLLDEEKPKGILIVINNSLESLRHYSAFTEGMGLPPRPELLSPEESGELERLSFELQIWEQRYGILPMLPKDLQHPDEIYRTKCEIEHRHRAIEELEEKKEKRKDELIGGMLREAIAGECQRAGIKSMIVFTQKELCSLIGRARGVLLGLLGQIGVDTVLHLPGCFCCFRGETAETYGQLVKSLSVDRVFVLAPDIEDLEQRSHGIANGIGAVEDADSAFKEKFESNPYPEKMFFVL